jgi:hypothetical protein
MSARFGVGTSILAAISIFLLSLPFEVHAEMNALQPLDVKTIVARVISAYGGEDAIKRAKRVYVTGDITASMRNDKGIYTRYMARDRKLRVETAYASGSSELRILNGKTGWRRRDKTPLMEVKEYQLLAMIYQYKQLDMPYGLLTGQYNVTDEGRDTINGAEVEVLDVEDGEGPPMRIYIDLKSFRIVRTEGYFFVRGNLTNLGADFSDFRKVDGITLPFKITNFGSGQLIGETIIKKYRINPSMEESLFRP